MLVFSKKQITPLIEKYQIDVENSEVFKRIITMFNDQTPYQIWAIKSVFEGICPIEIIESIKSWAEKNHTEVKNLTKGNIISYKTKTDFTNLLREMEGLDILNVVKNSINRFNTRQRNMMREHIIGGISNGLDVKRSSTLMKWFDIFQKMEKLAPHRKDKLISTSSAIDDINFLREHIQTALNATYDWNKDDMLSFMAINAKDCKVVFDKDNVVVLNVPSFQSSKNLCGNGRTGWCLTREERYFNQYVKDSQDAKQFFLFDFKKREDDELAHIGFTVRKNSGIVNAHSTKNNNMLGDGISYKGSRVNIHKALQMAGVTNSVFMSLKKLKFSWNEEALLSLIADNENDIAISVHDNHRIIVNALTHRGLTLLIGHTLINASNIRVDERNKVYVFFDFNLTSNDDRSVVVMSYTKDKYNIDSLLSMHDAYNVNITKDGYLETVGITTDMYLNREAINPRILLHKLIDEGNETEAVRLVESESDEFDVNFEFNNCIPVFSTIEKKMFRLFGAIVNHKNFNSETCDAFGESILQSLMYNYKIDPTSTSSEDEAIKNMIDIILNSENFDFNVQDINLDTAINIACERSETNWIVEKLASNPKVNINVINDFNCAALGNAIRKKNTDAIRILGRRPDLVIRPEDEELARQFGYKLEDFVNPQPMELSEESTKSKANVDLSELTEDFSKLFAKAFSGDFSL